MPRADGPLDPPNNSDESDSDTRTVKTAVLNNENIQEKSTTDAKNVDSSVDNMSNIHVLPKMAALEPQEQHFKNRHNSGSKTADTAVQEPPDREKYMAARHHSTDEQLTKMLKQLSLLGKLRIDGEYVILSGRKKDAGIIKAFDVVMELTGGCVEGIMEVSVKEVNPNPFFGADRRHPVGSTRQAVVSGRYAGGVFCRMQDDTTCLCLYSPNYFSDELYIGDTVLIVITQYDYGKKLIYGRLLSRL